MSHLFDLPGEPASTRLVVAMSGGVDSTVVAALAARAGYEVVGVTLRLYDVPAAMARPGACCAGADIADARRAAELIGIPHYVLDYAERFRTAVIEPFADSYLAGETPIPCVACNRSVKFTDLLGLADELGAAALATGHYAATRPILGGRALHRAADPARDQSYFLHATTPAQLARVRFPLGEMTKAEVRQLARDLGLPLAEKPDSQDICFVPGGRYTDMVAKLRPEAVRPGDVVAQDGRMLGRHSGIAGFTVGQRRGLGVAGSEPLYVLAIEPERARVVVGPRAALGVTRLMLRDVNWLGDLPLPALLPGGMEVAVRVRSTGAPRPARLRWVDGQVEVELATAELGVSPGQACVVYADGDPRARVLGGGTITRRARDARPISEAA